VALNLGLNTLLVLEFSACLNLVPEFSFVSYGYLSLGVKTKLVTLLHFPSKN
jgi:hypothetical protein